MLKYINNIISDDNPTPDYYLAVSLITFSLTSLIIGYGSTLFGLSILFLNFYEFLTHADWAMGIGEPSFIYQSGDIKSKNHNNYFLFALICDWYSFAGFLMSDGYNIMPYNSSVLWTLSMIIILWNLLSHTLEIFLFFYAYDTFLHLVYTTGPMIHIIGMLKWFEGWSDTFGHFICFWLMSLCYITHINLWLWGIMFITLINKRYLTTWTKVNIPSYLGFCPKIN